MKTERRRTFDPNAAAGPDTGLFGLPFSVKESKLVIIPVPWEATTSYGGGTSKGPAAILKASRQVDLYDLDLGPFYEAGLSLAEAPKQVATWNKAAKAAAVPVIKAGGNVGKNAKLKAALRRVNELSAKLNDAVYKEVKKYVDRGQIVGLVGGDHSTPFGAIKAYVEKYPGLGILHFDAHADLREAYEGFEDSHASIMYNVLKRTPLQRLVQVGIRDFSEQEFQLIKTERERVRVFFDQSLAERRMQGETWENITESILSALPSEVYVSFDIDGLDPQFCPHTGTPVPGGLSFQEAVYVLKRVVRSGRKIVGFDLNEVAPAADGRDEWDANVGARLLFKMCGWTLCS